MRKIKKFKIVLVISVSVIVLFVAYTFAYHFYGGIVSLNYVDNLKLDFENNVTNIQCINYNRIDNKYKKVISEEDLHSEKTIDEYLLLFKEINSIESNINFYQSLSTNSTDLGKHYPCETIKDSRGTEYLVYHHIYVASSLFFEPVIVKWTIDIIESKE